MTAEFLQIEAPRDSTRLRLVLFRCVILSGAKRSQTAKQRQTKCRRDLQRKSSTSSEWHGGEKTQHPLSVLSLTENTQWIATLRCMNWKLYFRELPAAWIVPYGTWVAIQFMERSEKSWRSQFMMRKRQFIHKNEQSKNRRNFSFYSCSFCRYKGLGLALLHLSGQMLCSHLTAFFKFSAKSITPFLGIYFLLKRCFFCI